MNTAVVGAAAIVGVAVCRIEPTQHGTATPFVPTNGGGHQMRAHCRASHARHRRKNLVHPRVSHCDLRDS